MFLFRTDGKAGIGKGLHDGGELGLHAQRVVIPDGYGAGEQAIGRQIHANFLPRGVDVEGLIGGVGVHHPGLMAGKILHAPVKYGFLLVDPAGLGLFQELLLDKLFHPHPARGPAIVQIHRVELAHNAHGGLRGIALHAHGAQMPAA